MDYPRFDADPHPDPEPGADIGAADLPVPEAVPIPDPEAGVAGRRG